MEDHDAMMEVGYELYMDMDMDIETDCRLGRRSSPSVSSYWLCFFLYVLTWPGVSTQVIVTLLVMTMHRQKWSSLL